MKKKITGLTIIITLLLLGGIITCCGKTVTAYEAQIDLGNKYLLAADYDQAIIAFNNAIKIDPKQSAAYFGLSDTYVARGDVNTVQEVSDILKQGYERQAIDAGKEAFVQKYISLADTLMKQGHTDWAVQLLENGYEVTGDTRLKTKADEIAPILTPTLAPTLAPSPTPTPTVTPTQTPTPSLTPTPALDSENDPVAKKLYDMMASEDENAALDFCLTDEFKTSRDKLAKPTADVAESSYFGAHDAQGRRNGMGAAYYRNGYVYYGPWVNGKREGEAVYFLSQFYQDGTNYTEIFNGTWKNDKLNGTQTCEENSPNASGDEDYKTLTTGTCINGLWEGQVDSTFYNVNGSIEHFIPTFENGIPKIIRQEKDSNDKVEYVIAENTKTSSEISIYVIDEDSIGKTWGILPFADMG